MTNHVARAQLIGARTPDPRTLVDVLEQVAREHPAAPALDDGTRVLTYTELLAEAGAFAERLRGEGVRRGDKVGIRVPSGTCELYVAIVATLLAGAAYVPVDADDPSERAELVFAEARAAVVVTAGLRLLRLDLDADREPDADPRPGLDDDAWVIFTSGSTGTPKGVAVTHRSAAAFVDAEARMFLQEAPQGPGDRVLAGLSVAFDASCEEMWLAWGHGACLVPAPRALVRTGMDLGPWLVERGITIVSTVPTLAALWPAESLDAVRLLIFGGEACPPELAERLVRPGREVWNTYGPTEATVVACGAEMTGEGAVSIGLPLDGWELAVVKDGELVAEGEVGELIIGGVGLARYLDPAKDAEKYAPLPLLGWERAYRSGDLVCYEPTGLIFMGRADEQIKLGGRRIELGEVDAALQALPEVVGAAAAVKTTDAGNQVLVGYVVPAAPATFDRAAARQELAGVLPAALVPLIAVTDTLPTKTSGKVDRAALPWPLPDLAPARGDDGVELTGTAAWLAEQWSAVLGAPVTSPDDDFFGLGGSSLTTAQLVSVLRRTHPEVTVADAYAHPRLADQADYLDGMAARLRTDSTPPRAVRPVPRRAQLTQMLLGIPLSTLTGLQWLVAVALVNNLAHLLVDVPWAPTAPWWAIALAWVLLLTPVGRMGITVLGARLLLRGLQPGTYPRGGSVHLRIWAVERLAESVGAVTMAGAPWIVYYAKALGATVGPDVDLHTLPPVTGLLTLGRGCSVEPEVDLAGHWLDGDVLHVGRVTVRPGAVVGGRSTLGPGAEVGRDAAVLPGSYVTGVVPDGQLWAGSPATRVGRARPTWPAERPVRSRAWLWLYAASAVVVGLLPTLAAVPGAALLLRAVDGTSGLRQALLAALAWTPVATVVSMLALMLLTLVSVRLLGLGLRPGHHPVRSRIGWQVWATERLLDSARTLLFPIYASLFTPVWLRLLGAKVGRNVEASTVLLLPAMTRIGEGSFLADDTMIASYELGGGWVHIERAKVGKRAFLGNSGMTAPGRSVPKNGLVAVLSAAPRKSKSGSSWLGSPPVRLQRQATDHDVSRTYRPRRRLKVARALVELCRLVPVVCTVALAVCVVGALELAWAGVGLWAAALAGGVVLLLAGVVAGLVTVAVKWLLVGRLRVVEHPLWSTFVWRNEVVDTFVEILAAPWFAWTATGTPVLNLWLRLLGATIGRGVWCETYWLPEADLVTLGDGVSVNRGCVLQTHLFHDRIMQMDTVTLDAGSTMGPHGVILPAASLGAATTVGPSSLVLRGEHVPDGTRWIGNPVAPWQVGA
ncbi:Pls/PosA family non-ribosomal peptide synthetase [Arsenicicoccus dermatophilus]|uniref:Pls/PosA family non-ribosomal peptide synthetase n=1 Tax=Arsenicicoccus dermatophilus TaxID=1076331 RepID=UPI001F4D0889|nr:Pls/PosA family non-ribosomal peptide synthetase [Arsenicicoccus dermatophilus]MCH8613492.1 amino acid adenylation domain-containing protein [Arsenicicoccus dermatophilus]